MFLHVYMCLWVLNTFRPVAETENMKGQTLHQWCSGTGSLREWQWQWWPGSLPKGKIHFLGRLQRIIHWQERRTHALSLFTFPYQWFFIVSYLHFLIYIYIFVHRNFQKYSDQALHVYPWIYYIVYLFGTKVKRNKIIWMPKMLGCYGKKKKITYEIINEGPQHSLTAGAIFVQCLAILFVSVASFAWQS